jgi:hypothetical protein
MELLSGLKLQLVAAVSALAGLIFIGTIVYHNLEGWTWVSSFYFSVPTITTVGYWRFAPNNGCLSAFHINLRFFRSCDRFSGFGDSWNKLSECDNQRREDS